MVQPYFKAQSEIDECEDVEDYDYGNHDDVRDENFASVKMVKRIRVTRMRRVMRMKEQQDDVQQTYRRTKLMEEHVEMINKRIEELEDINVALQVENGKRIKELEAKIIEEQLWTSKDNTNNQMLEKYQEDHLATRMDIATEFANPMDVSTRQNEANVQENASTTPESPEVDVMQKRVRKKRKLSCYKYDTIYKKRKKQDDDLPSYNQEINVETSKEAAKDDSDKLELLEHANKKPKMKVQLSKLKWGKISQVTYESEPPNVVCTTGWHLPWIQGERTVQEVKDHVKVGPDLGRSTNTGVQDNEYQMHPSITIYITTINIIMYSPVAYLGSATSCNILQSYTNA
ncbi:S2-RNase [Pyrus ussuriensis x Pyrus communis]|uniref:S2-RNase n=1 Tax=Pyrus ussuriensis x Pyrus communis TaxID=2448454 RepID=A0A5N5HW63_9ROSA|nr:S2-RNase [Pyrus ussuriensis x Pyrus communis]